jgi:CheY-like chemotaxis protein
VRKLEAAKGVKFDGGWDMSAQYHDPAISEDAAGTVDVVTEVRREAALLKTGALQNAIFSSANFSSIATDEKGVIQLFNVGAERMLGYGVIDARNGREGLKLCETHPGKIDLLVTDVVMPELGGRELAVAALKLRPGLKVVFVSGHTEDVILKEGVQQGAAFLHKPFTPMQLAQSARHPGLRRRDGKLSMPFQNYDDVLRHNHSLTVVAPIGADRAC